MTIMKKNVNRILVIAVSMICLGYVIGCHKVKIVSATTSDLNIYPYLQNNRQSSTSHLSDLGQGLRFL